LAFGFWLLAFGFWLLAFGFWLLAENFKYEIPDRFRSPFQKTSSCSRTTFILASSLLLRFPVRTFFILADSLWQDIRYALRNMFCNPGFTSIVVLCLALGIGANTAMFSVINAVLLRPLPFKNSDRLMGIYATPDALYPKERSDPTIAAYDALSSQTSLVEDITAFTRSFSNLTGASQPQWVVAEATSDNFFPMLGVGALRGRVFQPGEGRSGHNSVAVISYSLWQRQFGGQDDAIGTTIYLDARSYTVAGVMPKTFDFPRETDLWLPLSIEEIPRNSTPPSYVSITIGAVKGATPEQVQSVLSGIGERLAKIDPKHYQGRGLIAVPIAQGRIERVREALWLLFSAVGLVLLIACANVGNLFLARGWNRRREISIRAALGASRSRIASQMLVESVVIAVIGGTLGFVLAASSTDVLRSIAPPDIPRIDQLGVDRSVFLFNFAASILAGLLFGLLPVAQSWKANLDSGIKDTQAEIRGAPGLLRLRDVLTASEVTLCLTLLIASTLVIRSLVDMLDEDMGFRTDHLLTMRVALPKSEYPSRKQKLSAILNMVDRVRAGAGIEAASVKINPFLGGMGSGGDFRIGTLTGPPTERYTQVRYILSAYFDTLRVPTIRGRTFDSNDDPSDVPIAIVNESFAKRYFPGRNPIGERVVEIGFGGNPDKLREIVGEVSDFRDSDIVEAPRPTVFIPFAQCPFGNPFDLAFIAARTAIPPAAATKSIEQAIWKVDKGVPIEEVETGQQLISDLLVGPKFHVVLLTTFAGLGLVLALIGIFGVVSYSVGQRTREIGLRIALGAERGNIMRLVLRGGMLPVLAGIAIGTGGSLALTRLIQSFLYGVKPTDPLSFIAAALAFCIVAILACYQPARRATRVDPLIALRHE
jgi:putative ABC transport system permease protein